MDAFARWRREVDCEIAYVTDGMMTDDITYDWDRAYGYGYLPHEIANLVTKALYIAA